MTAPIKTVAVVGLGIGRSHLLEGYANHPDKFRVLAVCDLSQERSVEELGYWLVVAERILGKPNVVIVAQGRRQPDPLPIAEARLREISAKHRALVIVVPPGDLHRLEHIFRGLSQEAIRTAFPTDSHPRMYV